MELHYDYECNKVERICVNCEAILKKKLAELAEERDHQVAIQIQEN